MTLIKDENHLLTIDRQVSFGLHQVIEFLNGGYNDFMIIPAQITFQFSRTDRAIHTVRREALIFFHGLVVKVFAVHHKKHLVDEVQFGCHAGRLKAGQRFAGTCGVPDIAATFRAAPFFDLMGALDLPQNALGSRNLVWAHDEQGVVNIKH